MYHYIAMLYFLWYRDPAFKKNPIGVTKIHAWTSNCKWTWHNKNIIWVLMETFKYPVFDWIWQWLWGRGLRVVGSWGGLIGWK